jgi:hypothetical protein
MVRTGVKADFDVAQMQRRKFARDASMARFPGLTDSPSRNANKLRASRTSLLRFFAAFQQAFLFGIMISP